MNKDEFVFGFRPVLEAMESGKEIDRVIFKSGLKGELYREVFEKVNKGKVPFQFVPIEKMNRITKKNHQGIIAFISPVEYQSIENVLPMIYEKGREPFILVLDRITDVRNFGGIVRTAECAGVDAVIIPLKNAAKINADAIKTSAGALFNMNVCRVGGVKQAVNFLRNSGLKIVVASEKSSKDYYQCDFTGPVALIMGSEDVGVSDEILEIADETAKIPLLGKTDSLNVGSAASIIMYEVVRQRNLNQSN